MMNPQRVLVNQMILEEGLAPNSVNWGLAAAANPWPKPPAGLPAPLTTRDVPRYATMNGAKARQLDDKVGSLTPGKEADIIILGATRINVAPVNQVPRAVVSLMDRTNRRDRDCRRQGAQVEGRDVDRPVLRRQLEDSTRLRLQCGWHSTGPFPPQLTRFISKVSTQKPPSAALMQRKPFNMQRAGAHRPARSGNPAASASRVAGITPRSVMSPPTSRAGVTSNA
jgi:hypothetical protein